MNSSSTRLMSFFISGLLGCLLIQLILVNEIKFLNHWFVIMPILIFPFFIERFLPKEYQELWIAISEKFISGFMRNGETLENLGERQQPSLEYEKTHRWYRYMMYLLIMIVIALLLWITIFALTK